MSLQVSGFGTYGKVVIAAPLEGSDEPRQAVALKFPRSWRRETLGFDRLEVMKEADLLWKARGKHVVPLLHVFEQADSSPVLAFPAADTVLSTFLASRGSLSPFVSKSLGSQLACGVHHIHARGIIHRDLKPSNMLLRLEEQAPRWRLFLADFGSARQVPPATVQAAAAGFEREFDVRMFDKGGLQRLTWPLTLRKGTFAYLAPEAFAARYGCAADVWSVGAVSFNFVVGRPLVAHRHEEEKDVLRELIAAVGPCPENMLSQVPGLKALPQVLTLIHTHMYGTYIRPQTDRNIETRTYVQTHVQTSGHRRTRT